MRKKLKSLNQQRMEFAATVERFGTKSAFRGPPLETILLRDVARTDNGGIVTDHLWFTAGKSWRGLRAGDRVLFEARVGQYEKGYFGRREDVYVPNDIDYRLERPTKVRVAPDEVKSDA